MSTAIAAEKSEVARSLPIIAAEIKKLLKEAEAAAAEAKKPFHEQIGDLLVEARDGPDFGKGKYAEFIAWVERTFGWKASQANVYLSLGRERINYSARRGVKPPKYKNIEDYQRRGLGRERIPGSARKPAWNEAVVDNIERARREAERFEAAQRSRAEERAAVLKLASRIVEIGYRVLAKELHPDKGGTKEAFNRLKMANDFLKTAIEGR